jgi:hypothetical protein
VIKRKALFALFFANALVYEARAAALSKNDEAARDAAVQWLELTDAGRYQEAASQGSQEVRAFEQWVKYFTDHRVSLGRANQRHFFEIKRQPTFPGTFQVRKYYVVRFKMSFEHKPTAIEQVVLAKIGCCWEIFGYEISDK